MHLLTLYRLPARLLACLRVGFRFIVFFCLFVCLRFCAHFSCLSWQERVGGGVRAAEHLRPELLPVGPGVREGACCFLLFLYY